VLLENQDRARWDAAEIDEGLRLLGRALRHRHVGVYQIQAAIVAQHARAQTPDETDWPQIADLYAELLRLAPSPVVELNHAVAVAMARGLEHGLDLIDRIDGLERYHLYHAARADLLRRASRAEEASRAYQDALELTANPAERRFLERRLKELERPPGVSRGRGAG
jgi:predicted RNA polymerase sigma factor